MVWTHGDTFSKRFTYEEAEKSIKENSASLHKELFILNNLAKN